MQRLTIEPVRDELRLIDSPPPAPGQATSPHRWMSRIYDNELHPEPLLTDAPAVRSTTTR